MKEQEVRYFIEEMIEETHLEAFPQAANQALALLNDDNVSVYRIAKVSSYDTYIAATLIKLANSSFYGIKTKVTDLMQAISIIGLDHVKRLILTISAKSIFKEYTVFDKLLWEHTIAVAAISQMISFKYSICNENMAYLVGLMHDIGKIVMHKSKRINYNAIIEKINASDNILSVEAENLVYQFNHCDVGKTLLALWNFDSSIVEATYLHHNTHFEDSEEHLLSAIVNFSDYIANWLGIGRIKPYQVIPLEELPSLKALNIKINDTNSFLDEAQKRIELAKNIF